MLLPARFFCFLYVWSETLSIATSQRLDTLQNQADADNLLVDAETYKSACPDYQHYAAFPQYE